MTLTVCVMPFYYAQKSIRQGSFPKFPALCFLYYRRYGCQRGDLRENENTSGIEPVPNVLCAIRYIANA